MIIDGFMFFNELDLLEIRLHELAEVVDRFVLVEAPRTHSGKPKPLYFQDNRDRFAAFQDRIEHVVADDLPHDPGNCWVAENFQRRCISRGMERLGFGSGDAVLISDADEIPSAQAVRAWSAEDGPRCFAQPISYYWLNCRAGIWHGTRIVPYAAYRDYPDPHFWRFHQCPAISPGGWHFSYLGGADGIRAKLEAFAHNELDVPWLKADLHLRHVTGVGADIFGRPDHRFTFVSVDASFPAHVVANKERFAHLIRAATFTENWYDDEQLIWLRDTYVSRCRHLAGMVLEIGCWEGRSTIALANACQPETLIAVDNWTGSLDEAPTHATVIEAARRDVFATFKENVRLMTMGNVRPVRRDCHAFLAELMTPLKFVHLDAAHDYQSVRRALAAIVPLLVPGGVVCGDDFASASAQRGDLDGGVERAVRELPGFREHNRNFWIWEKP